MILLYSTWRNFDFLASLFHKNYDCLHWNLQTYLAEKYKRTRFQLVYYCCHKMCRTFQVAFSRVSWLVKRSKRHYTTHLYTKQILFRTRCIYNTHPTCCADERKEENAYRLLFSSSFCEISVGTPTASFFRHCNNARCNSRKRN